MGLILTIDTSTEKAIICLASSNKIIGSLQNEDQKDHASFLHPGIQGLLHNANHDISQLDAIAVVSGPGSYTGLKVSMATAKGLCYALQIPMICLNGLELMAMSASDLSARDVLYCPMIDARRMEVYTALYDPGLHLLIEPGAMILESNSFSEFINSGAVIFFGSGSFKFRDIINHTNAIFKDIPTSPEVMAKRSFEYYQDKIFSDLETATPLYLKEFYTIAASKK